MAVRKRRAPSETSVIVRCPCCGGLRELKLALLGVFDPAGASTANVVPRSALYGFWEARFSSEELREMGRAIWG